MTRRSRRRLAYAGLLAGLWLGCGAEPRRTGIAADRAAIYALLLDELPRAAPIPQPVRQVQATPAETLLEDENPSGAPWYARPAMSFPGVQPATVADFQRALRNRTSLRGTLPRARVWLIEPRGEGRRPRGLDILPVHAFSHIGFNPARTQALVYVAYHCGGMCGDGQVVLLDRSGGRWRITNAVLAWIA